MSIFASEQPPQPTSTPTLPAHHPNHHRIDIPLIKSPLDKWCCLLRSQFHQLQNEKSIHQWLVLLKPFQSLFKESKTLTPGIGPSLPYLFNACNRANP